MGLSGRVPARVDAATKAALLDLIVDATEEGWSWRGACRELELGEARAYRWSQRRTDGELDDRRPGGSPMHGLLAEEVAEIVKLYHEWGEVDRSHRKLAHRGSYLERVWVAPSSVRRVLRVLAAQGLHLHAPPRPGRSLRKLFLLRDPVVVPPTRRLGLGVRATRSAARWCQACLLRPGPEDRSPAARQTGAGKGLLRARAAIT